MRSANDINTQLEGIATARFFDEASQRLVDVWASEGVGFEAVEPVLKFMEKHPGIDYGSPGALVHFVERFYRQGYEAEVLASVARRPTEYTAWLLNRLINGEQEQSAKGAMVDAMRRITSHPAADEQTLRRASHYLGRIG